MNIEVKNARVNNLKNISLSIPHNKLIVITGVSGSGKSSLAFDTLYAEGQRRYVESLSAYIRQFLGRMHKPECDFIKNLPPAIAIEQKVISRNPRSTVGTTTEIFEYLKLLFARIGRTYSPVSGQEVKKHNAEDVLAKAKEFSEGTRLLIAAPLVIGEGRTLEKQLEIELLQGYQRIIIGCDIVHIEDFLNSQQSTVNSQRSIVLLIDRVSLNGADSESRFLSSVETAFYEGQGECQLFITPSMMSYSFSTRFEADGMKFEEPSENLFSFNSPAGACDCCEGFGRIIGIDEKLVIPDSSKSVYDGCVQCWHGEKMGEWQRYFLRYAALDNFPIFTPYYELSQKHKDWLWHGLPSDPGWESPEDKVCIDNFFEMIKRNQYKIQYRVMLSRYRGRTVCPKCHGNRLKPQASYVKVAGRSITDIVEMPVNELFKWFNAIELTAQEQEISERLLKEITSRLQFLCEVGLGYLTINRASNTLSGGESQRINLTTQLGSALVGSLYILDEPSIGLHSRDTAQLISVLKHLRDLGNTVIVVEHDEDIMRAADYIIDIGPDAGNLGGEIVWEGKVPLVSFPRGGAPLVQDKANIKISPLKKGQRDASSYTLRYLTNNLSIPLPKSRRVWNCSIILKGARMNNLKGCDAIFPLNAFTAVTGVSGSGKSSLVKGILYPALRRKLDLVAELPGEHQGLEGDVKAITAVEMIDQNPIGKSARSNAATYIKAYDSIRNLFAEQQLSKQMGYTSAYFSFNTDGGRCEECKGAGVTVVEMQFMADLQLTCETCHGQRFKKDILEVRFAGKNINDILDMTISEAISFFANNGQQSIADQLMPLEEVGLGYIKMGQPSSTLSGGENQRVKLAYYLGKEKVTPTLFIFDEPTTGLHLHDINKLLDAFNRLIARGHTIIVVEHNLEVIKSADYIIDLGPEGGNRGGSIIFQGKPEELVKCENSITGKYLKRLLTFDY